MVRSAALRVAAVVALAIAAAACNRTPPKVVERETPAPAETPEESAEPTPQPAQPTLSAPPKVQVNNGPVPREIWKEFSGEKAFAEVKKQVEIGPRPAGSAEIEKARGYIISAVEASGWEVERQEFTDTTPRGSVKFVNLIARFAPGGTRPVPRTTQRAIVCSHYDTKRFSTIRFYGANDGASSTGALVELARVLALNPSLASKLELVFFDGEEAFVQFTETDGLYGSRYYAKQLREINRAPQFKFGILWDMIGDSDLTITLPPDSPADLTKSILSSAEALGLRQHFTFYDRTILDDHYWLNRSNIPTVDIIDFNYLYWHTADDTIVRLSPASLQKIGAVTLHHLQSALGAQ